MTRIITAALILSGCNLAPTIADTTPLRAGTTAVVHFISEDEMSALDCQRDGRADGVNLLGCATWIGTPPNITGCVIRVLPPRDSDDWSRWRTLHHEFRHCQDGQWHADRRRAP